MLLFLLLFFFTPPLPFLRFPIPFLHPLFLSCFFCSFRKRPYPSALIYPPFSIIFSLSPEQDVKIQLLTHPFLPPSPSPFSCSKLSAEKPSEDTKVYHVPRYLALASLQPACGRESLWASGKALSPVDLLRKELDSDSVHFTSFVKSCG